MLAVAIRDEDREAVTAQLQGRARRDHAERVSPERLDSERRETLIRAISNILTTENAIFTFAQIIDGLPIADVAWDRRWPGLSGDHPIDEHEELCPGALEKSKELCSAWNTNMLAFGPELLKAFQLAAPESKAFSARLIELAASAIHQFAALLFQLDFRLHRGDIDAITQWTMPRPDDLPPKDQWEPSQPLPTIFNHPEYVYPDIYPQGVADMVGYWTEDRIFGGVVVFDRRAERAGDDGSHGDLPNIYLHPCRHGVTRRVTQLSDEQQQGLVDFLLGGVPAVPCPLPIIVDAKNLVRVDGEVSIVRDHIYRDIWERKPLNKSEMRLVIRRPQNELDYPGTMALIKAVNQQAGVSMPEIIRKSLDEEEGQ